MAEAEMKPVFVVETKSGSLIHRGSDEGIALIRAKENCEIAKETMIVYRSIGRYDPVEPVPPQKSIWIESEKSS
jgi:hypothetical protein